MGERRERGGGDVERGEREGEKEGWREKEEGMRRQMGKRRVRDGGDAQRGKREGRCCENKRGRETRKIGGL